MKIEVKKDFAESLNLPVKTIEIDGNLTKREDYFIGKIQEANKYLEAVKENENSKYAFNIAGIPLEIDENINSTEIINQIFKDIFLRYKLFKGNILYHNLGFIEKEKASTYFIKQKKVNEQIKYRLNEKKNLENKVRKMVEDVKSLGTLINYTKSKYNTLNSDFEINIMKEFFNSYKVGNIYTETKPMHFCPNCKSIVLKKDKVYEKSMEQNIYVLYKIKEDNGLFQKYSNLDNTYVVVNTIRPWILEANEHLVACENIKYSLVQIKGKRNNFHYIIAFDNVSKVMENSFYLKYDILETFTAEKLSNLKCTHPLEKEKNIDILFASKEKVLIGENCTGINILSTNNTYLDYLVSSELCLENNKIVLNIDGTTNDFAIKFKNLHYKEVNEKIINYLDENLLLFAKFQSKENVIKCRNCSTELIYRGVKDWYIKRDINNIENILQKIEELSNKVKEYNEDNQLKKDILKLKNVDEIKISSDSYTSIPIPIFYYAECGKTILNDKTMGIILDLIDKKGIESWYKMTPDQILEGQVSCSCGCGFFFKEESTLNNLYKLSNTPFIFNDNLRKTTNVCIETKEIFLRKMLSLSFNSNFVKTIDSLDIVMVHSKIKEDSKIIGKSDFFKFNDKNENKELIKINLSVIDVVKKYGTDVLRLWTAFKANEKNIKFRESDIMLVDNAYKKIRRTFKFLLSNLNDFNPYQNKVKVDNRTDLDKYEYAKLIQLIKNLEKDYMALNFNQLYKDILKYCKEDMCGNYFDVIKYRLYIMGENSNERRSAQSTLYDILNILVAYVGPILPFTVEEIWPFVWKDKRKQKNPLLHRIEIEIIDSDFTEELKKWNKIFDLKNKVLILLEKAKVNKLIKDTLEAKITINTTGKAKAFIEENYDDILRSLNVSAIDVIVSDKKEAEISKAPGVKCVRCNNYSLEIGKNLAYRYLCPKCAEILEQENKDR